MKLVIFSAAALGAMGFAVWLLFSGLRILRRTPRYHERTRAAARRRIITAVVLIALCNALVNAIPREWVIGPVPSEENNWGQAESVETGGAAAAEEILQDENRWLSLHEEERLHVLEQFANGKAAELGLRERLTVETDDLGDTIAGMFQQDGQRIVINEFCFRQYRPEQLVHIVCHEVRHAYQYALSQVWLEVGADSEYADLEVFREMEVCWEELYHYTSALEDMEAYRNQWIEEDARDYADRQLAEFLGLKNK